MKRQSVWLSTMMVLALMLIGYYTVNNNVKMVPVADSQGADQTLGNTTNDQPANNPTNNSTNNSGSQGQTNTSKNQSSDFFIKMHMSESKQEAAYIESLQEILSNSKSTSDAVAQAQQKMQEMTDMTAKADHVRDMLQANGFPDAIVIPNDNDGINFDHVTIYVQASQLTSDQAVQVMNIVHTQMGVPTVNISVGYHQ